MKLARAVLLCHLLPSAGGFYVASPSTGVQSAGLSRDSSRIKPSRWRMSTTEQNAAEGIPDTEDEGEDNTDIDFLFDEVLDGSEKAWRYASKPLLRIGAKGATLTHGNSLRQLLEDHTVVKVKVNTKTFDESMENAFETLKRLAEESGAPEGIEAIQSRESEKIILFGMPGTTERIQRGEFPPEPVE